MRGGGGGGGGGGGQDGYHFADYILKLISFDKNCCIWFTMSPINNKPSMVLVKTWRQSGDKPLSKHRVAYITDTYMRHSATMSY